MTRKNRNINTDLEKVRRFSKILRKRMDTVDQNYEKKINRLTDEELYDLNEIVQYAHFMLTKHEDKKEIHSLLKEFVDMIEYSGSSIDLLNDEISELVFSGQSTLKRIKSLQSDVSSNFSLEKGKTAKIQGETCPKLEPSTNNLTKSTTAVYT